MSNPYRTPAAPEEEDQHASDLSPEELLAQVVDAVCRLPAEEWVAERRLSGVFYVYMYVQLGPHGTMFVDGEYIGDVLLTLSQIEALRHKRKELELWNKRQRLLSVLQKTHRDVSAAACVPMVPEDTPPELLPAIEHEKAELPFIVRAWPLYAPYAALCLLYFLWRQWSGL